MKVQARVGVASAVAAMMALAGCSNGGGDGGGGGDLTYEDSPLSEVFAELDDFSGMSEEEMQAESDRQMMEIEELTAACMAEQGFEYIPVDWSESGGVISAETDVDYESREYAEQYGYGITTMYSEDESSSSEEDAPEDPNQAIVEAMSPAEQEAYYEALYGQMDEEPAEGEEISYEPSGCSGEAQMQVYGDQMELWEDPRFEELFEAMDQIYTDAENDPRMAELNTAWSDCMADAGHTDLADPSAAQDSIMTAADGLWSESEDPSDIEPEMADLREREIALATADWDCKDSVDYQQTSLEIQFEYEEEFVEEWQADIDALIAAYQEAQSASATETS